VKDRSRTYTLSRACDIVEPLLALCAASCPSLEQVTAAGGIRRFEPIVDDLIIVGCARDPEAAIDAIAAIPELEAVHGRTKRRLIVTYQKADVAVRIAPPDEFGTMLHSATGSPEHLNAVGARRARGRLCAREEDVYADAGLPWIPPELRQGSGEIEAAASRSLPALVELQHIRGDLHMHSIYSDGQDSMEAMVAASSALGYEYIAFTDHSERAGCARTLSRDDVSRQRSELLRLREQYPSIAILHGVEVDIMPGGQLDFPDSLLETLDIVVASLHDAAGQSPRVLTRRCIDAIRHPLVNVIAHPGNQIVGRRAPYPMDFNRIHEAASETGTALEVDGAPLHLDLDGEHARAAVAAGVTVTIDSDCHRARALARHMRFGVGTARRGWVEPQHVLNTRLLSDVQAFIAAKRGRR
jgi:DNA polymerase (family 10)